MRPGSQMNLLLEAARGSKHRATANMSVTWTRRDCIVVIYETQELDDIHMTTIHRRTTMGRSRKELLSRLLHGVRSKGGETGCHARWW